jgi:hypothetical protein
MRGLPFFILALLFFLPNERASAQRHRLTLKSYKSPINLLYDDDEEEQEDSIKGLSFGLNLGGYFANKATANFYNGSCPLDGYINEAGQVRCYSIEERLDPSVFIQDAQTINNRIGSQGYSFPYDTYPTNMRYNPAMYVGLQLKYNFNRYSAVIMNVNALRLVASSQFSMVFYGTPAQINAQNDVRLFSIVGNEQRMNLNIGYRQGWMMGDFSNFYMQFGGSMLATKWTSNTIRVADTNFELFTSAPIAGQTAATVQSQARVGFGGYASAGFEFFVGKYTFDLSFGLSRDKVAIFSFEKNVMNKWLQASFTL